jgi:hypothetical protein
MKKMHKVGFDKVIMQAVELVTERSDQAIKKHHKQEIKLLSRWRNYRIGMGGAAVSSSRYWSF